jgi:hypothetical protein
MVNSHQFKFCTLTLKRSKVPKTRSERAVSVPVRAFGGVGATDGAAAAYMDVFTAAPKALTGSGAATTKAAYRDTKATMPNQKQLAGTGVSE